LKGAVAARGQEIFIDRELGKCNACHFNGGANGDPDIFGPDAGNLNFDTGVEDLPDQPARMIEEDLPGDDGHGIPGTGEFNTPTVVEAADTGPFFHNNAVETIEGAVSFYNGDAFNDSPAGLLIRGATGSGINLDATQVVAVAAFLRVINALENIRATEQLLNDASGLGIAEIDRQTTLLRRAGFETEDSVQVLAGGGLHPAGAADLRRAGTLIEQAIDGNVSVREGLIEEARAELARARDRMVTL
jgi:hypothetical protein